MHNKLGNSDMEITPIGIGAWAMGGGGWEFGWGPQDDDANPLSAIHAALDGGINWIDTAAVYGLGHSEEVVGARSRRTARTARMCSPNANSSGTKSAKSAVRLKAESIRRECERQSAPPQSRYHRSLSGPLAGACRRSRGRLVGHGQTEAGR